MIDVALSGFTSWRMNTYSMCLVCMWFIVILRTESIQVCTVCSTLMPSRPRSMSSHGGTWWVTSYESMYGMYGVSCFRVQTQSTITILIAMTRMRSVSACLISHMKVDMHSYSLLYHSYPGTRMVSYGDNWKHSPATDERSVDGKCMYKCGLKNPYFHYNNRPFKTQENNQKTWNL